MARDPREVVRAWGVLLEASTPWRRSLRLRAIAVVLVVVLLPLAIVAVSAIEERRVGARLAEDVRAGAVELARHPSAIDAIARKRDLRVRVVDAAGRVVTDVDHEGGTNPLTALGALFFGDDGAPRPDAFDATLPPLAERTEVRAATSDPVVECRASAGSKLLACAAAVRAAGADGPALFYVQASSRRAVRALYDLRYEISKLVVVMLPVALLLAWWLGWRTVRPIEQLRAQVLASARRASPSGSLDLPRRDEIGDLAAAMNGLLRTLDERRAANEAFVADLVHEFKNPVAAIRACAEQLHAGASAQGADPRTERLARILDQSGERLDALVTQFLELARAEAGIPTEARAGVDLAELARRVVESSRADVRWISVRFVVLAPEHAIVRGVAMRLESALRNLVDNAASFAGLGGEVAVTVDAGESVRVSVHDSGPGIAEADLPRVFDRFFTTRGRAHGTGLGLALVKAVIVAHGGEVSAESTAGEGATFRLVLPRG